MGQQQQLFNHENPPFRRHSTTSKTAAAMVAEKTPSQRERVLMILGTEPLTDEGIAVRLGMRENTVRPRRIELLRQGLIVGAGTALTSSGRPANLWRAA
jgi:predicted ArsR family transcriptional regulator